MRHAAIRLHVAGEAEACTRCSRRRSEPQLNAIFVIIFTM
jgi:hypothetical protein